MAARTDLWCDVGHFNEPEANKLADVVRHLRPKYVIETGFCTGRSACAALHGAGGSIERFVSVDINYKYRPEGPAYRQKFHDAYPDVFESFEQNSRTLFTEAFFDTFFKHGVDFATVDGDHSFEGCSYDIETIWSHLNSGGIIFVDDYMSGPPDGATIVDVNRACDEFMRAHPEASVEKWRHPGGKGACIFKKA